MSTAHTIVRAKANDDLALGLPLALQHNQGEDSRLCEFECRMQQVRVGKP
jgi:hypothetical protein